MAFRGLFIGIDRYASADIDELSCARRDALALEALFSDTLGGTCTLLVDQAATRSRISSEFAALADCSPEDTVVISFSGHGSESHELIAHDTVINNLGGTAIELEQVQTWLSAIPARRLILFLDCCFSGGLGAKVLKVDVQARGLESTEVRLAQLAGDGRIVFTASSADQPAYEHHRYGHGLLTYFLIEALRGAQEVASDGRLSLYKILDFVTARVKAAAAQKGRPQTPTMRGQIDGDLRWPVFVAGEKYLAAFPHSAPAKITNAIESLTEVGFPQGLVQAWAGSIPRLNDLQVAAVNEFGVLGGAHLVVSAPTSSGKTMIGELAALRHILERKRALFLLPLKALVADKRRQFDAMYGAFGIRTIEATGETDDLTPLMRGHYDIALLTYEKFAAIALTFPHVLRQAGVIVVDEAQMIADEGRGANLEFVLTLIRMRRREDIEPQIIALSAVIGDTNGLEDWLGARLLRRDERPVPLDEGLLLGDGRFRFIDPATGEERIDDPIVQRAFGKGSSQDWIIPLVRRLMAADQQVIVFRETKGEARGCANYLADALGLPSAKEALSRLPQADPSQASHDLRRALMRGVAFHHSDLTPEERRVVEEEFRRPNSGLRVIAATTTLAMGVNTPASSVIIAGLAHPGDVPYSVAEYKNLAGRAGRLGYAEKGTSYLLALDPRTEHHFWKRYVVGSPENLVSRFLDKGTDPRSLIVRVLASASRAAGDSVERDEIIAFLESSFGGFQSSRANEAWQWSREQLVAALDDLVRHGLVENPAGGGYRLTRLGQLAGESGAEVKSIISFVDCLRGLAPQAITDPVLLTAAQTSVELDQVTFPINKKSTQKEPQLWPNELRNQGVPWPVLSTLHKGVAETHQATLRAKKAVACLLFISGRPMTEVEAILTQFGGALGGAAGAIRGVASRTCDLLPAAARTAEVLHPQLDLSERAGRLAIRLSYGVPAAAVDLARETGTALLRGDYCRLASASLLDVDAIEAAPDVALLECLDGNLDKLDAVRQAVPAMRRRQARREAASGPILNPYVA
jgi:helicase